MVLREKKVTNYELTAISKGGRTTTVSYNASTFKDAEGRLQGVFAAARDITEQKKLEGQLRDSEAYNRGLIEASVDGLVTVDPAGSIQRSSPSWVSARRRATSTPTGSAMSWMQSMARMSW